MTEYRWEFEEIGQGHYFLDHQDCLVDALENSKKRPDLLVKVERFRPDRRLLCVIKNGIITETWQAS